MKKLIVIALCIFILSLAGSFAAGALYREAPLKSVVSMYADGVGGYYCIEIYNSRYFWRHMNEDGAVIAEARLKSNRRGYFYSCNGIVADDGGNVYIASYEKDSFQKIHSKYVQVFDKNGKKLKVIFETPLDSEKPDETEKLKSLQYLNGKVSMFEMLDTGRLLHYEYDCLTGLEKRIEYIVSDGGKMLEATYSEEAGVFYTTDFGEIYLINSSNEYERLELHPGNKKIIPMRLSCNNGGLYFTDVHNLDFMRYDLTTKNAEVIYTADDYVGNSIRFRDLRFVRWYNGTLYAHSPIFTEDGFLARVSGEPNVIRSVSRNPLMVLIFAAKVFAAAFAGLSLISACVFIVLRLRSLFLKLVIILTVLSIAPVFFISAVFAKTFNKQITNEVYAQLYSLAVSISSGIDGKALRELEFPEDRNSYFVKELFAGIRLETGSFKYLKYPDDDYIPKNMFYTLYTIDGGTAYYAYGYDYPSGMRDEYMQLHADEFFANNPEYNPRTVEYRDKYGTWTVCRAFIMDGDMPVGMLETGIRSDMVNEKVRELVIESLSRAALISACGMVVLGIALRRHLKGLKILKKSLSQMTDGNWSARAIVKRGDEIEDIANDFNKMARHIEKYVDSVTRLNAAYKKFVPNELFELLGKNNVFEINLGDQSDKNLNIMSVNIRDFHSISKSLTALECFDMLNGVFASSSRTIRKAGGFIESFGGFGLRAVFVDETDSAVDSAMRLIEKINARNKEGGIQIRLNITVQNSDSMIGIAGDSERMAETVISEATRNIGALEEIAEKYQIGVLVTEDAFNKIVNKEKYNFCQIGEFASGYGTMALYDFFDACEPAKRYIKAATKPDFERGFSLYKKGLFHEARKKFVDVLREDSSNEIAKLYLFRCDGQNSGSKGAEEAVVEL